MANVDFYSARREPRVGFGSASFFRVVLNMQASIACVLDLVTCQSNKHIWRDCFTIRFVAASGVGRYRNMLEVDLFWHFSCYALSPLHTLYKHIVAVKATIDKQSPHAKLLLKSAVF